jgi:hypothetical protein
MILSSGQFVSAFLRKIAPKRSFTVGYKTVFKMIRKYLQDSHKIGMYFSLYSILGARFFGPEIIPVAQNPCRICLSD